MFIRLRQLLRRGRGQEGAAAVEFALILPLLIFLILGGMDLGHMYYIEHLVTSASREGARYGSKYTGTTAAPTSGTISDYVKLPAGLNYNRFGLDTLVVSSTPPTGTFPNSIMTVTVTANKHWWVLGTFNFFGFAGFTNPKTLSATTAMNVEH
jgi:Flp pilus assembly protein TadG